MTDETKSIGLGIVASSIAFYGADAGRFWDGARTIREVNARHAAWLVMRRLYGFSFAEAGKVTGHDHTTVMSGTSDMRYRELREDLKQIQKRVSHSEIMRVYALTARIRRELLARPELIEKFEEVLL